MIRTMPAFHKHHFEGADETLDGNKYRACTFTNCRLVFRGGQPPTLVGCGFTGCTWVFEDAAARTLQFLRGMYHGMCPGGRNAVDEALQAPQVADGGGGEIRSAAGARGPGG